MRTPAPSRRSVRRGNAFLAQWIALPFDGSPLPADALVLADPPKPRAHPEQDLQQTVAEYLTWALAPPWWFTAIGHGGGGAKRGAILKSMGVKSGVPDLLILGPHLFVGWIELKSAKGRRSLEQIVFAKMAEALGHCTAVCRSLDEVRTELLGWRAPLRETKASADTIRRGLAAALDAEAL